MCPTAYYNIQPTILLPISYACLLCFYIFLSLRPDSSEAGLYRAMDASIIQIATFIISRASLLYSNPYWCWVSVVIVSSFGQKGNVSIRKNLMSGFSPYPSNLTRFFISSNKLQTLKKYFTLQFIWFTHIQFTHYIINIASKQQSIGALNTIVQHTLK